MIYQETKNYPRDEQGYGGIVSQLRRAIVSSLSQIAEGSAYDKKQFAHYLKITIGSLREVKTQLDISFELKYIGYDSYKTLLDMINEALGKTINYKKKLYKD